MPEGEPRSAGMIWGGAVLIAAAIVSSVGLILAITVNGLHGPTGERWIPIGVILILIFVALILGIVMLALAFWSEEDVHELAVRRVLEEEDRIAREEGR